MIGPVVSALRDVRANLIRSLVSAAAVIVAVTAVLIVDATTTAARTATATYLTRQFGLAATLEIPVASLGEGTQVVTALKQNGVRAQYLLGREQIELLRGDHRFTGQAQFIDGAADEVRPMGLMVGTMPRTAYGGVPQIILDQSSLAALGIRNDHAVGTLVDAGELGDSPQFDEVRAATLHAVVAGVHATEPDGVIRTWIVGQSPRAATSVVVRVNEADITVVSDTVATVLPNVSVNRTDRQAQLVPVIEQQQRASLALSLLALLIGGLGLLTTRLAVIRERRVELGIRRSLGATRGAVVTAVLTETLVITAVASCAAVALASILFPLTPSGFLTHGAGSVTRLTLPLVSVLRGILGAGAIGMIAALVPAIQAGRTSVVEAVRR